MSIETTLAARETTHGDFRHVADMAQALEDELFGNCHGRRPPNSIQREAIVMICRKLARIMNGDPAHADHWHDIEGYARLASGTHATRSAAATNRPVASPDYRNLGLNGVEDAEGRN